MKVWPLRFPHLHFFIVSFGGWVIVPVVFTGSASILVEVHSTAEVKYVFKSD